MKKKFDESAKSKKTSAKKTPAKKPAANKAAKKTTAPAKPKARMVTIPAHTVRGFDGLSCHEDGMAGRLRNCSDAYIENQYGYDIKVPEQTIAFTAWDKLPPGMDKKTVALLREAMDREDRLAATKEAEAQQKVLQADRDAQAARDVWMQDRIVVSKPIVFRRP